MADLGNSKIKDTYTLVLQTDASGNLQNLDGTTPNPFVVNGTLKYTVGPTDGYVLTSDASGNASWEAGGAGTSYWSANTDGSISPSGLTTTIQTQGDLRVSGTVYTNHITTTATSTDRLIIQSDTIDFQSHGGSIDYLRVKDDAIQFYLDSAEAASFKSPSHASAGFIFNSSTQDLGFVILAQDSTNLFRTYADTNAVHIRDHVMISSTDGFPPLVTGSDWALAVTGSSLFYSGGSTNTNANAISAVGDISGTTDLYLGSTTHTASTITAEESLTHKRKRGG